MSQEYWTREELYNLVWDRPMTSLAKEYLISDVGLRKVCVKHEIPVPQIGHWAKVKAGQTFKRPPLSKKPDQVKIFKPEKRPVASPGQDTTIILDEDRKPSFLVALAFEQEPANTIKVSTGEDPKHEIALRTLVALLRASKLDGIIQDLPVRTLDVRVSQASARRSISIMDALLDAFEKRGWLFEVQKASETRSMSVSLLGTNIEFWLEELCDRIPHVLTSAEEKDKLKNPWKYSRPTSDHIPSGNLALKLNGEHDFLTNSFRSTWADNRRQRLDCKLNQFCSGLIRVAIARSNGAIKRKIWEKERAEAERLRKEEEYRKLLEETRMENLKDDIRAYEKMIRIQRYIDHVRDSVQKSEAPIDGDLATWIEWAEKVAKRYDPLRKGMPKYEVEASRSMSYNPFLGTYTGKQEEW